jgi:hypothetical protein
MDFSLDDVFLQWNEMELRTGEFCVLALAFLAVYSFVFVDDVLGAVSQVAVVFIVFGEGC